MQQLFAPLNWHLSSGMLDRIEAPHGACVRDVQFARESVRCWKLMRSSIWYSQSSSLKLHSDWMNRSRTIILAGYGCHRCYGQPEGRRCPLVR